MSIIYMDALPPRTSKGKIVRMLVEEGGITSQQIGKIDLNGWQATVEVPDHWVSRLVKALDGARLDTDYIHVWSQSGVGSHPRLGGTDMAVNAHFHKLLRLLVLEAEAEKELYLAEIQKAKQLDAELSGTSLVRMVIRDVDAGLGGRYLVTFAKRTENKGLPWTRLTAGKPVLLTEAKGQNEALALHGVVNRLTSHTIEVSFASWPDDIDAAAVYRLDFANDEISRTRQRKALERASGARQERLAELRDILMGVHPPAFYIIDKVKPFNPILNESQREAVEFALSAHDVGIIHGPPGTGKTTAVVELVRQAVLRGQRVLVCAPSNTAVDNVFARLIEAGENAVRFGHPARVHEDLREHTLEAVVERHSDMQLAQRMRRDAYRLKDRAARDAASPPVPALRHQHYQVIRSLRAEANELLNEARQLEAQAVSLVLDKAPIVCSTLTGLDGKILGQRRFDLCVIDEAAQATEPSAWVPILRSNCVILAGDHKQLPPTVISDEAKREGFGYSMMERLMSLHRDHISRQLITQYRMNNTIMAFSSEQFYNDSLVADETVAHHTLAELPYVDATAFTETPVTFIDTAGANYDEEREKDGTSYYNPFEADLVCKKIEQLFEAGVKPADIGIITPYSAQVRYLLDKLPEGVEASSVDGFQGREKQAIIISLVRSNLKGDIGFLADQRRMNVAMTRARRKLIVIGDSCTISAHVFYQRFLDYIEAICAYSSVWEEM